MVRDLCGATLSSKIAERIMNTSRTASSDSLTAPGAEVLRDYRLGDRVVEAVQLTAPGAEGAPMRAVVCPALGMSLVEFTIGGVHLLEPRSVGEFLSVRKGLGPLIVPHFNQGRRVPPAEELPPARLEGFPHVRRLQERGIGDPFQHGVGRYVSWPYETYRVGGSFAAVSGRIDGSTECGGLRLAVAQGFDFSARVEYRIERRKLEVRFDVEGEQPVACGIHFYYRLPDPARCGVWLEAKGPRRTSDGSTKPIPESWGKEGALTIPLAEALDDTFLPVTSLQGTSTYRLVTPEYQLDTVVPTAGPEQNIYESVVIFSPAGADFVCLEPLSAREGTRPLRKKHTGFISLLPRL